MSNIDIKRQVVEQLCLGSQDTSGMFFVNIQAIKVASLQVLRTEMRQKSATVKVAKVRLIKRALRQLGFSEQCQSRLDDLVGQVAIIFVHKDASAVAKALVKFQKSQERELFVLGGVCSGGYLDESGVKYLANLPPYEVIMAQCARAIAYPLTGLAVSLNQILGGLARVLQKVAEQKQ